MIGVRRGGVKTNEKKDITVTLHYVCPSFYIESR